MKGSENLLSTARAAGVQTCFANPGTTEIPLVEAFDEISGIRPVLALTESVVTGAADGYTRMSDAPAITLLHLGPGFANGIANLHNARRAHSPVINLVGEHTSWHQSADPPLASDIESLAAPVSGWVGRTSSTDDVAETFAQAHQYALQRQLPATLIAAADHLWDESAQPTQPHPVAPPLPQVDAARIHDVAMGLHKAATEPFRPAVLLGSHALNPAGITAASQFANAFDGAVFTERAPRRIDRAPNTPVARELPYFPEDVLGVLDGFTDLVLVGADTPVAFFGYEGQPSHPLPPGIRTHTVATPFEEGVPALEALVETTGCASEPAPLVAPPELAVPEGPLTPRATATAIVLTQPDNAIIVNEGVSAGAMYGQLANAAPAHSEIGNTGGAIGCGPPLATGAAVARPDRPVITFQADGSAAYTVQALWTQAREKLNVTTVILSNSQYRILRAELGRSGVDRPGTAAQELTNLTDPAVDWVAASQSFGVPAERVSTGAELVAALHRAHAAPGPRLIEAMLS